MVICYMVQGVWCWVDEDEEFGLHVWAREMDERMNDWLVSLYMG